MTGDPPRDRPSSGWPSPADWARLESMVDALLDTPPERRAALFDELSGGDAARRAELEKLVVDCERPHALLEQPAAERFTALVDEHAALVSTVLADRYQIMRELGRGGMATVYLARDVKHSRDVAIKVLRRELAAALGGGRFLREIEIAAGLRHPNIVPVYDSGETDGVLYYVMPYEAGQSLRDRLARDAPLPLDEALLVLRDVSDALACAHRHGIVHRDVKPDNVLLSGRHAMVTDFGVAKALSAAARGEVTPSTAEWRSDTTTAGVSLGTPAYMAPEQVAADPRIDHRADIYSFGALAYELLTGRPPFQGDEPQSVLAAHLTEVPKPVALLRPDVPPALAEVVMTCLAKKPADRWQTADEVLTRIERLLAPGPASDSSTPVAVVDRSDRVRPPTSVWFRRSAVGAAVGAATLALAIFAINRARGRAAAQAALDPRKIAVVPFRVVGVDSSLRYLGEGVVDLLASKLTGEGGPLAVDSRTTISTWKQVSEGSEPTAEHARRAARLVGAGGALTGTILGLPGNRLTITASELSAAADEERPTLSLSGSADSVSSLLDALAIRLIARHAGVSEQALGAITGEPIAAQRAYLWGRADHRRGQEARAVEHFARALEIDSTFALAALDLVVAAGQPLGLQARCVPGADCVTAFFALGFRNPGAESDHRRIARAGEIAWLHRDKLGARDRPLLEALRGDRYPELSSARNMLAAMQRAATAAPDRAETHYLLGSLLLYQGPAVEIVDPRPRAAAAFRAALALDPEYVAPMAGLVEVAAFERDTAELRRVGAMYLSRDAVGATADYVRWRVASGLGDETMLSSMRSRFDALDASTLQRIVHASLMSGLSLGDAERAVSVVVGRASDRVERRIALASAYMLAMNRGRPREAADLLRRRSMENDDILSTVTWATMAALFWDGDSALAHSSMLARMKLIARDTLNRPRGALPIEEPRHVSQQGLWDFMHGDTANAAAAVRWLRQNNHRPNADFVDVLLATQARRPDSEMLRTRLDSIMLEGCCGIVIVHWANLIVARAHEAAGDDVDALRAVRRGVWRFPPQLLSTFVREEGRLAAKLGDHAGAIRAYRHYLALRSDPEPELRPERDRVRAELARLEQGR